MGQCGRRAEIRTSQARSAPISVPLDHYLVPEFGRMKLDRITRNDLEDFLKQLVTEKPPHEPLDGVTLNNIAMPLRVIYRHAVRRGEVAINPTHDLELAAPKKRPRRVAPPEEFRAFLAQLSTFDRAFWAVVYFAGLRHGKPGPPDFPSCETG